MCFSNGQAIFVLRGRHVSYLSRCLTTDQKANCCIHYYDNGYLIYFKTIELWASSWLQLDRGNIFYQKFY